MADEEKKENQVFEQADQLADLFNQTQSLQPKEVIDNVPTADEKPAEKGEESTKEIKETEVQPTETKKDEVVPPLEGAKDSEQVGGDIEIPSEGVDYLKEITRLQKVIDELSAKALNPQEISKQPEQKDRKPTVYPFIKDDELDDFVTDANKVNEVLSKAVNAAVESVLKGIPNIVQGQINNHQSMQDVVNNFYAENPDLIGAKRFVGFTYQEIQRENPNLSMQEALVETAKRARQNLGITKTITQTIKKPEVKKVAGLPKSQGSKGNTNQSGLTDQQQIMATMIQ